MQSVQSIAECIPDKCSGKKKWNCDLRSLEKNGKMDQIGRQMWQTSHNFISPKEEVNNLRQETTAEEWEASVTSLCCPTLISRG